MSAMLSSASLKEHAWQKNTEFLYMWNYRYAPTSQSFAITELLNAAMLKMRLTRLLLPLPNLTKANRTFGPKIAQ